MSAAKTREELLRLAWLTALRQQGARQCPEGDHCALSLLHEQLGEPDQDLVWVAKQAGLSEAQASLVMGLNDGPHAFWRNDHLRRHTFAEIADIVTGWFGANATMTEPSPAQPPASA